MKIILGKKTHLLLILVSIFCCLNISAEVKLNFASCKGALIPYKHKDGYLVVDEKGTRFTNKGEKLFTLSKKYIVKNKSNTEKGTTHIIIKERFSKKAVIRHEITDSGENLPGKQRTLSKKKYREDGKTLEVDHQVKVIFDDKGNCIPISFLHYRDKGLTSHFKRNDVSSTECFALKKAGLLDNPKLDGCIDIFEKIKQSIPKSRGQLLSLPFYKSRDLNKFENLVDLKALSIITKKVKLCNNVIRYNEYSHFFEKLVKESQKPPKDFDDDSPPAGSGKMTVDR